MVQLEPNLLLTLKNLGPSGVVVPAEQQAALDHSIPIKRSQSGLSSFSLWGRITSLSGKDYLIASGSNGATARNKKVTTNAKYFFSQDGIRWADLPAIDADLAAKCATLKSPLVGDPQAAHALKPVGAAPDAAEGEEDAPPAPEVGELARLRAAIDAVTAATDVVPKGSLLVDGSCRLVANPLFTGVDHPAKLESFVHTTGALDAAAGSLAQDVRGSWTLHHDSFKGCTVLRSLLWPGYCFYYSARDLTWGGLYSGSGVRNDDLVFML